MWAEDVVVVVVDFGEVALALVEVIGVMSLLGVGSRGGRVLVLMFSNYM